MKFGGLVDNSFRTIRPTTGKRTGASSSARKTENGTTDLILFRFMYFSLLGVVNKVKLV